jgi:hypothetical protein
MDAPWFQSHGVSAFEVDLVVEIVREIDSHRIFK